MSKESRSAKDPQDEGLGMAGASHTPGPWIVSTDVPNYGRQIFIRGGDEQNTLIAEMNHIHRYINRAPDNVEADARLIAAAPELLEALKRLIDSAVSTRDVLAVDETLLEEAKVIVVKAEGK